MARLIVTATASPLFGNFLMHVSVSAEADGQPTSGLTQKNFTIADLASFNHSSVVVREIVRVSEGPAGFYAIQLKPWSPQPTYPSGQYAFAVAVTEDARGAVVHGQTVAVGSLPA